MPVASPSAADAPAPSPGRLLWDVARRRRVDIGRRFLFVVGLSAAIALMFTAWFGGGALRQFVYSFSIGMSCWTVSEVGRLAFVVAVVHTRLRQGLPGQGDKVRLGWPGQIALMLLSALIGPVTGVSIADILLGRQSPPLSLDSPVARITLAVSLLAVIGATLSFVWQQRLTDTRAEAQEARRAQAESQLRLLQSQLEPHMLFNTLANLRVLIGLDPPRAQAMLDRLIGYLRATLQASRRDLHPLADEFERVADYLALMDVRMGPRLAVGLDLPPALRTWPVPPLILQPLVENSIRHGLEPQVAGGRLFVRAEHRGHSLQLDVVDDGVGLTAPAHTPSTGFGLEQVRARLAALYGNSASFSLEPGDDGRGTRARIRLPAPIDTPRTP